MIDTKNIQLNEDIMTAFADDIAVEFNNPKKAKKWLKYIEEQGIWEEYNLNINYKKTKALTTKSIEQRIGDIEIVKQIKYLGININTNYRIIDGQTTLSERTKMLQQMRFHEEKL